MWKAPTVKPMTNPRTKRITKQLIHWEKSRESPPNRIPITNPKKSPSRQLIELFGWDIGFTFHYSSFYSVKSVYSWPWFGFSYWLENLVSSLGGMVAAGLQKKLTSPATMIRRGIQRRLLKKRLQNMPMMPPMMQAMMSCLYCVLNKKEPPTQTITESCI